MCQVAGASSHGTRLADQVTVETRAREFGRIQSPLIFVYLRVLISRAFPFCRVRRIWDPARIDLFSLPRVEETKEPSCESGIAAHRSAPEGPAIFPTPYSGPLKDSSDYHALLKLKRRNTVGLKVSCWTC